jgi:hypothetical protein
MSNGAMLQSMYNCVTKIIWSTNEKEIIVHQESEPMPHVVVDIVQLLRLCNGIVNNVKFLHLTCALL